MCILKDDAKTKIDRLIAAVERLCLLLEKGSRVCKPRREHTDKEG